VLEQFNKTLGQYLTLIPTINQSFLADSLVRCNKIKMASLYNVHIINLTAGIVVMVVRL